MVQFSVGRADDWMVTGTSGLDTGEDRVSEVFAHPADGLWDHGPTGAFRADADGNWLAVNPRWQEITGLSEQDAISNGLLAAAHPEDRLAMERRWERVVTTGELSEISFRFFHPERGLRYATANAVALRDSNGDVTAIVGTLFDETDRCMAESALRDSEELHRLTIANLPGFGIGLYDREMRCLLMEGIEDRGMTTASCRGKHISELAPLAVVAELMPGVEAALGGNEYKGDFENDGAYWRFQTSPYRDAAGEVTGFLTVAQERTEERRAREERQRADNMFRTAFDRAPIGMSIIGLDQRFEQVNAALEEMLGLAEGALVGTPIFDIVHADDRATARAAFQQLGERGDMNVEFRFVGAAERVIQVDLQASVVLGDDSEPLHILAQTQDVTEWCELIHRLEHLVEHDSLTGVLNRRGFERALTSQIAHGRRYGNPGSLLVIDLDGFKSVNDTLGHAAGDEVIAGCSEVLLERLRSSDVIGRLGGDEFAVVLPEETPDHAAAIADDLLVGITNIAAHLSDAAPPITASIGIASLDDDKLTPDEGLIRADRAMYEAKRAGKNRVVVYDDGTTKRT